MSIATTPSPGGAPIDSPVFVGVATADAFTAVSGGPAAHAGSFRASHDIDVLVGRDPSDTVDVPLISYISGAVYLGNASSLNYALIGLYSGGAVYHRFGGVDAFASFADRLEHGAPGIGGDPVFAPSPFASNGEANSPNPDADFDETPDIYRFRRVTYQQATTAARVIYYPDPGAAAAAYYEKTFFNATGHTLIFITHNNGHTDVTIANNKTAIVGFNVTGAVRVTADV